MSVKASALENLSAFDTPTTEIKWRSGQRQHDGPCDQGGCRKPHAQLAYVDARYVMGVLDTLIGPANWRNSHTTDGQKVTCSIGFLVEFEDGRVEWIDKADGAGETDIEGEKGSYSDSFKRAAVRWGIGRDLYSLKPQSSGQQPPRAATQPPAAPAQVAGGSNPQPPSFEAELSAVMADQVPTCPTHNRQVKEPSQKAQYAGYTDWKCTGKNPDGSWCNFTWTPPA